MLGNVGQANYAAANGFMDAFVAYRRACGQPATTLQWGPWSEVGMATTVAGADVFWANSGFDMVSPKHGLDAYNKVLLANEPAAMVATLKWKQRSSVALWVLVPACCRCYSASVQSGQSAGAAADSELAKLLGAAPADERPKLLQQQVKALVLTVLESDDPDSVGLKQPFNEMGIDSLLAVELRNVLSKAVGTTLSGTVVFDFPNIDAISGHLLDSVLKLADAGEGGGKKKRRKKSAGPNEPLAVVGMACRLPAGANTPDGFWDRLCDGIFCVSEVPSERFDIELVYDVDRAAPGPASRWGGYGS